jgi:hypothetical protein
MSFELDTPRTAGICPIYAQICPRLPISAPLNNRATVYKNIILFEYRLHNILKRDTISPAKLSARELEAHLRSTEHVVSICK